MHEDTPHSPALAGELARAAARHALVRLGALLGATGTAVAASVAGAIIAIVLLAMVLAAAIGAPAQTSTAVWPAPVATDSAGNYAASGWVVSSRYGWRAAPDGGAAEFHDGIDLAHPDGRCPFGPRCAVPSIFDGAVTYVGWDQAAAGDPSTQGGGQIVTIANGQDDHRVLYAHLEPYRLYVQLQGRIEDAYGRYDAYGAYQPIGQGELQPDLEGGAIEMTCRNEMPNFIPARTGPGTITFLYDRPADCVTAVVWGRYGGGWHGWVPDEPRGHAGDRQRAELRWSTPIEPGRRAGDVALRFRALLVPPPPPPTEAPTGTATLTPLPAAPTAAPTPHAAHSSTSGTGGPVRARPALTAPSPAGAPEQRGMPDACEALPGSYVRCTWALAALPTERRRYGQPGLSAQAAEERAPRVTPSPTALPADGELAIEPRVIDEIRLRDPDAPQRAGVLITIRSSLAERVVISLVRHEPAIAPPGVVVQDTVAVDVSAGTLRNFAAPEFTYTIAPDATPGAQACVALAWRGVTSGRSGSARACSTVVDGVAASLTPTPAPPPSGGDRSAPDCAAQPLVLLPGVRAPNPRLARVAAESFAAVRAEILARTGVDALSVLADSLRHPAYETSKPGVLQTSWHKAGRAIDLDIGGPWARVAEGGLYRLYLGGVDITAIFEAHGWRRIPAQADTLEWWHYEYRPDGIAWASAMLQVWDLPTLSRAFPEIQWAVVGCAGGSNHGFGTPPAIHPAPSEQLCTLGAPLFASAVEAVDGCGPPVRAGDRVHQLDTRIGYVGLTGRTSGPHLHLGLQVRSYDGAYPYVDICTQEWLQGQSAPAGAACFTDMADPLAFLPRAPGNSLSGGASGVLTASLPHGVTPTLIIPEGAPYQLPPPDHPNSLLFAPAPGATPVGQYWSPHADGGRYGGGAVGAWFCAHVWSGLPWCTSP